MGETPRARPVQREKLEQMALMELVRRYERRFPALRWLHHIPNGEKRDKATAGQLHAMGVRPGVADLFLPCQLMSRFGLPYAGLYIEMKWDKNPQTEDQAEFERYVWQQGYYYSLCRSAEEAWKMLMWYLGTTGEDPVQWPAPKPPVEPL